ncbi:MAG: hypothetical protein KF767_08695 [Bdellovibrionaceae bacterium]|nr:hypothetical protein [Pseudobdellovibrionaceae bacterium]
MTFIWGLYFWGLISDNNLVEIRRLTRPLTLFLLVTLWLLIGVKAFAQLSARPLKLQSEQLLLAQSKGLGLSKVMTYYPRGQKATDWQIRFEILRAAGDDHVAKARSDWAAANESRGNDRYAGAQLLVTKSGKSVFLDQYRTDNNVVESIVTRYFQATDGLVIYRWTRRMPSARLPADASARHLEVMRFIERERQKRVDLLTDFATKKDVPLMERDDPMGMKSLPAKPKSQP